MLGIITLTLNKNAGTVSTVLVLNFCVSQALVLDIQYNIINYM